MKHSIFTGILCGTSLALLCAAATVVRAQGQAPPETVYKVGGSSGAAAPKCPEIKPMYTEEARQAKAEGRVVLDAVIHPDGSVTVNKVVSALGHGLDETAKKSVEETKCTPGQYDGKPVPVRVRISLNFHL